MQVIFSPQSSPSSGMEVASDMSAPASIVVTSACKRCCNSLYLSRCVTSAPNEATSALLAVSASIPLALRRPEGRGQAEHAPYQEFQLILLSEMF
jgi:hypothetical protein